MSTEQKTRTLWDKEAATKAKQQHKYIFVSEGQKQRKYKVLSGSKDAWYPKPNKTLIEYIYIPEERIMGLQSAVTNELKKCGKTDAEIKSLLKSAYTSAHQPSEYHAELEQLALYKSAENKQKKEGIKYGLDDLPWFIENIRDAKEEPIDKTQRLAKASPKSKRDIFRAMLEKAQANKQIIDVSHLDSTGAKLRNKSHKNNVHSDTLPYIESDNIKSYRKAIEWAFGSTDKHEADIESIKSKLAERKKTGKAKGTTKKTTPKKQAPPAEASSDASAIPSDAAPSATPSVVEPTEKSVKPTKKKQMGSPRKAAVPLPGTRSPGSVATKGGSDFSAIPKLDKSR